MSEKKKYREYEKPPKLTASQKKFIESDNYRFGIQLSGDPNMPRIWDNNQPSSNETPLL